MKKFNKNMLAHINANRKSTQTEETFNTNKKGVKDLEKVGVIL